MATEIPPGGGEGAAAPPRGFGGFGGGPAARAAAAAAAAAAAPPANAGEHAEPMDGEGPEGAPKRKATEELSDFPKRRSPPETGRTRPPRAPRAR